MIYYIIVLPDVNPYTVSSRLESEGWALLNASGPRGENLKLRAPNATFLPGWLRTVTLDRARELSS